MQFAPGQVHLPTADAEADLAQYDEEEGSAGGFGATAGKVQVTQQINHAGEVNRARVCPQNKFLIATKTVLPLACLVLSPPPLPRPLPAALSIARTPVTGISWTIYTHAVIGGLQDIGCRYPPWLLQLACAYQPETCAWSC